MKTVIRARRGLSILPALVSLLIVSAPPAFASGEAQRVDHFEAPVPATVAEAATVLDGRLAEMKAFYAAEDWNGVHEMSYHLEAALERLRLDEAVDAAELEAAAATLERVHIASEEADEAVLDADFPKLEAGLRALAKKATASAK